MTNHKKAREAFEDLQNRVLSLQIMPMPKDTIADNYISAGWLLSQMDLAGGKYADDYAGERAVTVGIDSMSFSKPVFVGDQVSIYTEIARQGRSSMTLKIESFAHRRRSKKLDKVTEGFFTFVAIDDKHRPIEIKKAPPAGLQLPPVALKQTKKSKKSAAIIPLKPPSEKKLALRTITMPCDANYLGDIFGGWILDKMDVACAKTAEKHTGQQVATVGVTSMTFLKPVHIGDEVSFYADVNRTGETSISVRVETWATRKHNRMCEKVTEGCFTYVAIDNKRRPVPVRSASESKR